MTTREEAARFADVAAAAVLGTSSARVAGFAAVFGLSPSVLAQFLQQNAGAPPDALYGFAVASSDNGARLQAWARADKGLRAAVYVFASAYRAFGDEIRAHDEAQDELRRARQAQQQGDRWMGERTFEAQAPGFGDQQAMRRDDPPAEPKPKRTK